jgi:taurine dioxygenase
MSVVEISQADAAGIEVVAVAARTGAEIRGVRLGRELSDEAVRRIWAALLRHKVIFFRDQHHLDDAAHEALAERLGDPIKHPNVAAAEGSSFLLELGAREGYSASRWHTDMSFMAAYPTASILRPLALPDTGGDTMWANTAAAYEDLPAPLKLLADNLKGIHTSALNFEGQYSEEVFRRLSEKTYREPTRFEAIHPVVRVHPETGERSLILGEFFKRFVGLDNADSRRLQEIFQDHITAPENVVRWRWRLGDVAIWDNRATQHRVVADFGDQARTIRRATIHGPVPIGVDGEPSRQIKP